MKVVGLITEYNPFHNGHKYHIERAKQLTGADYCIAVMSGNFVQRGAPAIIDKYSRASMALHGGVDLVLELPVCYATGSAEFFSLGAVSLLHQLGVVDYLCFGSEAGNITPLEQAANFFLNPPNSYEEDLQYFIKSGLTYPAARLKAFEQSLPGVTQTNHESLVQILTEPNNILGIEYLKALYCLASEINPVTIKRESAPYHESTLSKSEHHPVISSATAIRRSIQDLTDTAYDYLSEIKYSVPSDIYDILVKQYRKSYPITEEDFSGMIKYKLLSESNDSLSNYLDITKDLSERLKNMTDFHYSYTEFVNTIKTKNLTLTRIQRAMMHLLLNIRTQSMARYIEHGYTFYARVLGLRKESSPLLRKIEKCSNLPIITKVAKASSQLDPLGFEMLSEDIFAAHLYHQIVYEKYRTHLLNEYQHGIVLI